MAECKNCVHNKVCSEVNSLKCRKDFIWYDAKSGCPYYTADVVPKSVCDKCAKRTMESIKKLQNQIANKEAECAELICKLECFLCHVTGSRLSKHTYDLGTMESVATDCINETYNDGYDEGYKDCAREIFEEIEELLKRTCEKGYCGSISDLLAELKKKYTEDYDESTNT